MFAPGHLLYDWNGRAYYVLAELPAGGQGSLCTVQDTTTGETAVAKIYHPYVVSPEVEERLNALIALNLPARSPALCGPTARLHPQEGLGAIMPLAGGVSLETLFENASFTLIDALGMGAAACRALVVLEGVRVAHGDIAATNLLARSRGTHSEVFVIDFDNAHLPGAPPPSFRGQDYYCAPELLVGQALPTLWSDRFALAVLLHEIIYLRHPFAAMMQGIEFKTFVARMQSAVWPDDPALGGGRPRDGLPVGILPGDIHELFRRALQAKDPGRRPSAAEWIRPLETALTQVFVCGGCGGQFVNTLTQLCCPHCQAAADEFELAFPHGVIPLRSLSTTVGRAEVRGDATVSRAHASFRRHGFGYRVRNCSPNGLAVRSTTGWRVLTRDEECDLAAGDYVRFAPGVEGVVRRK